MDLPNKMNTPRKYEPYRSPFSAAPQRSAPSMQAVSAKKDFSSTQSFSLTQGIPSPQGYSSPHGMPCQLEMPAPLGMSTPYYPSQSADYMSFMTGGEKTPQHLSSLPISQPQPYFYQQSTPYRQPRHWRDNSFTSNNRRQNNWHHGRNNCRYQGNFNRNNQNSNNQKKDTYSLYFHKSMLEDPWKELLERQEAIKNSVINDDDVIEDDDDIGSKVDSSDQKIMSDKLNCEK